MLPKASHGFISNSWVFLLEIFVQKLAGYVYTDFQVVFIIFYVHIKVFCLLPLITYLLAVYHCVSASAVEGRPDKTQPIKCYQCNSFYDKGCSDFFDNITYPLISCPSNATMCRKIIQESKCLYQLLSVYWDRSQLYFSDIFIVCDCVFGLCLSVGL